MANVRRAVGDGAELARPALRTLASECGCNAPAPPAAIASRHLRRKRVARGCSLSHDRCTVTRDAGASVAFGISRIERPNLCDLRWPARRVVFQSGRRQCAGGCSCASVVSLAIFSRAHDMRRTGRLDSLPERSHAPGSARWIFGRSISPYWRSVFPATWHAGMFPNRTVLLVYNGRTRSNHSRGDSSSAVATSARRSGACA